MLFQRDYILRMIEMMGDLMRRVGELLDDLERMRLLDAQCRRHCGLSMKVLEDLSEESLREMLAPTPRFIASELLYAHALTCHQPYGRADALLSKSAALLASLWTEGELCELRAERMKELKVRTLEWLTPQTLWDCACFFDQAGFPDEMEDALFEAAERAESGQILPFSAQEGARMLRRAAYAAPETLAARRMTREELLAAADEFAARFADTMQ